jgi:hypothetical protein
MKRSEPEVEVTKLRKHLVLLRDILGTVQKIHELEPPLAVGIYRDLMHDGSNTATDVCIRKRVLLRHVKK